MMVDFGKETNNAMKSVSSIKGLLIIILMLMLIIIASVSLFTILFCFRIIRIGEMNSATFDAAKVTKGGDETAKVICNTKSCIKAANLILENLNETVDPCENFYEFSCGSFSISKRLLDDQAKIDEFSILRDKLAYIVADILAEPVNEKDSMAMANAKKLYYSCMDENRLEERGIEHVLDVVNKELGGWPILQDDASYNKSNLSLIDRLLKLRRIESSQIFEIYVSTDPKDPTRNTLRVSQPIWFFNKEYLFDEKMMSAYKRFMFRVIQVLNPSKADLEKEINAMFDLEREFSMLQSTENEKRGATFKNTTLKNLEILIPNFEWLRFTKQIFNQVDIDIADDELILIDDFDYLNDAAKLYSNLNKHYKRDLENLLIWIFFRETVFFLPKYFQDARLEFDKIYEGTKVQQSRSLACSNFVNRKMEEAVGRLYIGKYFNKDAKKDAVTMIDTILSEFKKIVNSSDWMDDVSREAVLDKIDTMDFKIGYLEDLYNDTYLDSLYEGINFTYTEFFENYYNLTKINSLESLDELRNEQDPKDWISGPAVVNAFYGATGNQICFPAGILQSPFYDYNNPKYLNYGAIGTVIGHEITHGFDDQGRLYDKDGVFFSDEDGINLWSNKTIENYKTKAQCIVDQYDSYVAKQINKTVNGFLTQGENIADNGGIKQAFYAYKGWSSMNKPEPYLPGLEKYTHEQMFFISFGQLWCGTTRNEALLQTILNDSHAPGDFRVIGSTSNFEEFGRVFNCKPGSRNFPTNKCSVW